MCQYALRNTQISAVPAGENEREHDFVYEKTFCREKVLVVPVVGTVQSRYKLCSQEDSRTLEEVQPWRC